MKQFFELIHEDKNTGARAGIMHTDHGDIPTPCFMPVGTQATVKGLDQTDLEKLDAPIILGNTYHLHLRPGEDLIAELGGLHKFMNWNWPILTDSGGFQVFSLGAQKEENGQGGLVDIDEDGVTFRSHLDGATHRFTPEVAIQIQKKLGADIIMAFDECTPDTAPYEYTKEAMERTHRWAERCLAEHRRLSPNPSLDKRGVALPPLTKRGTKGESKQFLFGIIQGANHQDLREESGRYISSLDFDGIAIGGESIGYNMEATGNIMNWLKPILPKDKPRYTMGVGLAPSDLLKVVGMGADMFDCVAPTRLARHGMLFVNTDSPLTPPFKKEGDALPPLMKRGTEGESRININNAPFAKDTGPIDKNCDCEVCAKYTRAYLHHLFAAQEMTGQRLASIHNIHFMLNLMREARQAILEDRFAEFVK
ncbi:MAG: tRNA guanosine(34) transglycosylase Tgt [Patescibacteria group bacterium]|nr:tRNA guanosine(34) transglycosylase Tgt [Patescibacteria group bacterium]